MAYLNPPYASQSNPLMTPQNYQPSVFPITDITRGQTTTITMGDATAGGTSVSPNYVVGQQIKVIMKYGWGMRQINNRVGYVVSLPTSSSVEVDIDSSEFNAFITSPSYAPNNSQIIAMGDVNTGALNENGPSNKLTYIPGSFRNIS